MHPLYWCTEVKSWSNTAHRLIIVWPLTAQPTAVLLQAREPERDVHKLGDEHKVTGLHYPLEGETRHVAPVIRLRAS
jgi:hypothetical protein